MFSKIPKSLKKWIGGSNSMVDKKELGTQKSKGKHM
jgi:hypothetical protein